MTQVTVWLASSYVVISTLLFHHNDCVVKIVGERWGCNSVRVVLLKAPCWRAKWAYVGIKWPHEMNPERVQLFRIRHVIGRSKTRTGFENHTLSLSRGRLVPRQPRAFKSITATQLHYRLISRLLSLHTFKSISAMQVLHEKCFIVQHNIHCHP